MIKYKVSCEGRERRRREQLTREEASVVVRLDPVPQAVGLPPVSDFLSQGLTWSRVHPVLVVEPPPRAFAHERHLKELGDMLNDVTAPDAAVEEEADAQEGEWLLYERKNAV